MSALIGNPLLLTSAPAADDSFTVEKSLRFNAGDDPYLNRTFSAGNRKLWTVSMWLKRGNLDQYQYFFTARSANTNYFNLTFTDDQIKWYTRPSSGTHRHCTYKHEYKDTTAWMHVVMIYDTANSVESDRARIFVNGERLTDIVGSSESWPSASEDGVCNDGHHHEIGAYNSGSQYNYDGYISDFYFIDGLGLDPSAFAEYSTAGNWQPKEFARPTVNDGTTWSNEGTFSNMRSGTGDPQDLFDGDLSSYVEQTGQNTTWTWTGINIPVKSSFRINSLLEGSPLPIIINDDIQVNPTASGWTDVPLRQKGHTAITKIACPRGGSGVAHSMRALEIDGVILVDGQTDATSAPTGNSCHLKFNNTSDIGEDSLNSNDWTANNLTVTGTTKDLDSLVDSPTNAGSGSSGGSVQGNYCVWNTFAADGSTLSQGNLRVTNGNQNKRVNSTFQMSSGKWYWEIETHLTDKACHIGIADTNTMWKTGSGPAGAGHNGHVWVAFQSSHSLNGYYTHNGSDVQTNLPQTANGDTFQFAYDADTGKFWMGKNNTWITNASGNVGNPGSGTNEVATVSSSYRATMMPVVGPGGGTDQLDVTANFGARAYKYTVPSGFKPLCTQNLPDIFTGDAKNNPSKYFDVRLWTGDGQDNRTVGGLGFQPDLVWLKLRPNAADGYPYNHNLYDVIRGAGWRLEPNDTAAQSSQATLDQFNSDGFRVDNNTQVNESNKEYVSWNWDAGTAAATASTDGSITPSAQWVNATAGFSISQYTGGGNSVSTVGHGLNAPPELIIVKNTGAADDWAVYHTGIGNTKDLCLNSNDAPSTRTMWNNTSPTNTVFTLGAAPGNDFHNRVNQSGQTYIAYAWTPIEGYSAFGAYTGFGSGNSAVDGPFQYCGFRPRWLIIKAYTAGQNWAIWDLNRNPLGYANTTYIRAADNNAEATYGANLLEVHANGWRTTHGEGMTGDSGTSYIWAAFADQPFKTARAR